MRPGETHYKKEVQNGKERREFEQGKEAYALRFAGYVRQVDRAGKAGRYERERIRSQAHQRRLDKAGSVDDGEKRR